MLLHSWINGHAAVWIGAVRHPEQAVGRYTFISLGGPENAGHKIVTYFSSIFMLYK